MTTIDYKTLRPSAFGQGSGGKSGGGSSRVAQEDPNTLRSNSLVRAVNLISSGPCHGLVDADKSVFLDGTALQAADGTYNFTGISWTQRTGEADQAYIEGFASAATTLSVNVEVTHATPIIRTLAGPIDAARITIGLPYLASQNTSNGDLLKTPVSFTLSKRVTGTSTWTDVMTVEYNDKCVATFQESFRIPLGGSTDWDIKYTRNTADSVSSALQNKTNWAYTTLLTENKFIYPNSALVAMSINAKQFGSSVPTVSFDFKGVILKVPSNYDPDTRTYTGIWDGTFTTAWTDNPAWVLYGLLTDKDYGLGYYIEEAQVDKYALYEIAQYCDELVPNGFGGTEPRFTFNYQFTTRMDAYAMLQLVTASFRGLAYWSSGRVHFVADMPVDAVKTYNETNVKNGIFTYEGVALSARHSVALVTWFDPSDQCKQAVELVEDPDLLETYGWREVSVVAYGCTSRGQANRLGRWILDTEKHATETVNFEVAWDSLGISPGDVIEVYDQNYAGVRHGGRIVSSTATSVTVDAAITIAPSGHPYILKICAPDGSIVSRTLTNTTGSATVLTFADPLSVQPIDGAVWGVSSAAVAGRPFRVLSVKETGEGIYAVSALQYDPTKYARVEQDLVLDPISYTRFNRNKPSPPTEVSFTEYVYRYDLGVRSGVTITWTPSEDEDSVVRGYEVEMQRVDGDWVSTGELTGTTADIKNVDAGEHNIRVRAVSFTGVVSDWYTKSVLLFGVAAPPAQVSGFSVYVLGDTSTAVWTANTEVDISHYVLKYSPLLTGATWETATVLVPSVVGTSVQIPTLSGTFLIKAVDLSGSPSANATLVINEVSPQTLMNAVAALSDWPTWSGTLDGLTLVSDTLELEGLGTGTYTFDTYFDLGEVYTSRVSATIDADSVLTSGVWESLGVWETLGPWASTDSGDWTAYVQLRTTKDDPAGTPTWTGWQNLVVGDYEARAFEFRVVVENFNDAITTTLYDATISVDMPDRVASEKGIVSDVGGEAIVFDPAFKVISGIGITGQNLATGDYFEYTAGPSETGFTILWRNASGTAVSRTFDYIATGYGRVN